jgi:hypothetical protein
MKNYGPIGNTLMVALVTLVLISAPLNESATPRKFSFCRESQHGH